MLSLRDTKSRYASLFRWRVSWPVLLVVILITVGVVRFGLVFDSPIDLRFATPAGLELVGTWFGETTTPAADGRSFLKVVFRDGGFDTWRVSTSASKDYLPDCSDAPFDESPVNKYDMVISSRTEKACVVIATLKQRLFHEGNGTFTELDVAPHAKPEEWKLELIEANVVRLERPILGKTTVFILRQLQ